MKRCLPTTRHFLFFLCTLCMLCVALAVLASCGENPKPSAHTHDFGAYEHDATYHWKQCTGCSEVKDKTAHTYVNGYCSVCGIKQPSKPHTHSFSDTWSHDVTYHWHAATCEHTNEVKDKAAHTYVDGYCSVCGSEQPSKPHTHSFPDAWSQDETYHWKKCTGCSEVDKKAVHSFGEWVTTLQPTTTQTGEKMRSCSVCGYEETAEIPCVEPVYRIIFNLNGGQSSSFVASKSVKSLNKDDFFFDVTKSDFNFRGWSCDGVKVFDENGTLVNHITMKPTMTFIAEYANNAKLTIVSNMPEAGTVSGGGEYEYNTEVDVSAHPNEGYVFVGWYYGRDVLSQQEDYKYKMWDRDVTLTAYFRLKNYKLSLKVNNSEKGGVAINPSGSTMQKYNATDEKFIPYTSQTTIVAYSKAGTRFLGWFDATGALVATNASYTFNMPIHDYELTAKWDYFTISYDLNGGTNHPDNPTSYERDMANIKLQAPTKSGVTFAYWLCNGERITEINTKLGENLTLIAIWNDSSYKITYDYAGGTASNSTTYTVTDGYTLQEPTRTGYEFLGWTGSNGDTPQKNLTIPKGTVGDKSYRANWKLMTYRISYVLSGGTNATANPTSYTVAGGTLTLRAPSRRYYTFKEWQYNGQKVTSIDPNLAKDITLTAVWTPIEYTITYVLNGGNNSASNPTRYTVTTASFTLAAPQRTGYRFLGWTGSNGTTPMPSVKVPTTAPSNLSYTANWEAIRYTITYDADEFVDLAGLPTGYTVEDAKIALGEQTREHYRFAWQIDGKTVTAIDTSLARNVTVKAVWTPVVYTITYDLDGGTNADSNPVSFTVESNALTLAAPTKIGYTFLGWTWDDGEEPTLSPEIAKGSFGNRTYTAHWRLNRYTFTFVSNGGSTVASVTQDYGATVSAPEAPTFAGKSFAGWYSDAALQTPYTFSTVPAEDVTLYAKWTNYDIIISGTDGVLTVRADAPITAETFGITATDTDGNPVEVTVKVLDGEQVGGATLILRASAAGLWNTTKTARFEVKVYGTPTMTADTARTWFNLGETLTASWWQATAADSFGGALTVSVSVQEETYAAGDTVTVVLTATDALGNVATVSIPGVRLYGTPDLRYNTDKTAVKATDALTAELFGATAQDSFGETIGEIALTYTGTFAAGQTVQVTLSATDAKGNTATVTFPVRVYGTPVFAGAAKTDYKPDDSITPETLGLVFKDSFGDIVTNVTLQSVEGAQTAGTAMTYTVIATDALGNTLTYSVTVRIYGTPELSFTGRKAVKDTDALTAAFFGAVGKDSFGQDLTVLVTVTGEQLGGQTISVTLTVTDAVGHTVTETVAGIRVYSAESLQLTYNYAASDRIRMDSKGAEFFASATDSFGEAADTSIEIVSGTLKGGNVISLRIVATDAAGNRREGEVITNIRVYGLPSINYRRTSGYLRESGESLYQLFIAKDSFGEELDFDATIIDGTRQAGETVTVRVSATDALGQTNTKDFRLLVTSATVILTFDAGEGGTAPETMTLDLLHPTTLPKATKDGDIFYAWLYNGKLFSDENGNILAVGEIEGDLTLTALWMNDFFTIADSTLTGLTEYGKTYGINLVIPSTVTVIGREAFKGGNHILSVVIPSGVTSIGNNAFEGCYKLVEVLNLSSLTITKGSTGNGYVGYYALNVRTSADSRSKLITKDGYQFYEDGVTVYLLGYLGTETRLTLPEKSPGGKAYSIYRYAFYGCTGLTSIIIPNSVTSIENNAFSGCTGLTSITVDKGNTKYHSNGNCLIETESKKLILGCKNSVIPSDGSVTSIGYQAFYGCTGLISITIPDSVTSIGMSAFSGCTGLTSVTIGSGVTSIGSPAFRGCEKLVEVYNLSNLTITAGSTGNGYVGYYAKVIHTSRSEESTLHTTEDGYVFCVTGENVWLVGYTGTDSVLTLPETYNGKKYEIHSYAFSGCTGLTSVTIPNSVTSIEGWAFFGCKGLTSITIPDSVTSIGHDAFRGCTGLTSVTIGNSVTSIGYEAFSGCTGLTSITIPNSVTSIGEYAFSSCTGLTSVTIGSGVTSIGDSAFDWCYKLVEVLNLSRLKITKLAFDNGCVGFYALNVRTSVNSGSKLVTKDGYQFYEDGDTIYLLGYLGTETRLTLPEKSPGGKAYFIYWYAFSGCTGLTSITIPNSVTSVGKFAFSGCTGLTSITIPNSVTSIGEYAFSSCTGLTSITIPNSVTSIGEYAFSGCTSLISIEYSGTTVEWANVNKGSGWNSHTGAYTIYCSDGTIEK